MNMSILLPAAGAIIIIGILWFVGARFFGDGSVRLVRLYIPLLLAGSGALLALFTVLAAPRLQGQLSPRGGGSGLPTPDVSVIEKPAALPAMCSVPKTPTPPKDMQVMNTCSVIFPQTLQVNSYCLNPVTKLGGATVILPQGTSQYAALPKNCSVVVDEEKLYAKKVACYGPSGSKVTITVQDSCIPPDASLPAKVEPSCPPDFQLNANGVCEYVTVPNAPLCPTGTIFSSASNCCLDVKALNLSPCPEGYYLSPSRGNFTDFICQRRSLFVNTTFTQNYTITLGTCSPNNKNDAPQNTDEETQPGCIIDPFTGACQ